jgi:hypothetical protein
MYVIVEVIDALWPSYASLYVLSRNPTYQEGIYLVTLSEKYVKTVRLISGFRHGVNEICVLLLCYAE